MSVSSKDKTSSLKELQIIPGIGKSLSEDLYKLGFHSVISLKDQDPEGMYHDLQNMVGAHVDRCVLYTFRCAVYFASNSVHEPDKLKWWNWKDNK